MERKPFTKNVIIYVDDEKIALDTLIRQLFRHFQDLYDYEVAESGEEALKLIDNLHAEGKSVKMVIADQIMPGMKGDELLTVIHNSFPSIVTILLTGQASLESAINAINKAGIYRYVTKPWDEQSLMQIIEKGLEVQKLESQKKERAGSFLYQSDDFNIALFRQTSKEDFMKYLPAKRRIFVFKQYPADHLNPIMTYQQLAGEKTDSCLIKIHHPAEDFHYSFLGFSPYLTFEVKNQKTTLLQTGKVQEILSGDPIENLWKLSQQETPIGIDILPPSFGGLVGFIGHDAVRLWENVPSIMPDLENYPDLRFQGYRLMLSFDHKRDILTLGIAADSKEEAYGQAMQELDQCFQLLSRPASLKTSHSASKKSKKEIEVDLDDATFRSMVEKAKEEIGKGNVLKVILSRTFKRPFTAPPLALYRATIMLNPSPYHFLLNYNQFAIVGASPEKLMSAHNGELESEPVAGTYARTGTTADALVEAQLLNDPKINIEHMMPVDVVRSDLASVSVPGSVKIKKLKALERFSHVVHVVSYLTGTLREDLNPLDALKATFPAGTLCGVPRVRSLEMVENIELSRRGPYGGVVCLIDGRGNLDSGIIIRTAFLNNGTASVRTGAGIVFDSDPQKEADETRHKSKSMMNAMNMAEDYFS